MTARARFDRSGLFVMREVIESQGLCSSQVRPVMGAITTNPITAASCKLASLPMVAGEPPALRKRRDEVAVIDLTAGLDQHLSDRAVHVCDDAGLHLHGF